MSDLESQTAFHDESPKLGRNDMGTDCKSVDDVEDRSSYDPSKNRMDMAMPVKSMHMTPNKLKGAKALKLFIQHKGNRMTVVSVSNTATLYFWSPNNPAKVSPKTMEIARHAKNVLSVADAAGIQLVRVDTDRSHASRYDLAPV
jgi:hypothetical protein